MLNTSQAQVTDAVLTNLVIENKRAKGVSNFVAPIVPVDQRFGQAIVFNNDAFYAPNNTERAPGSQYEFYTPTFGTRTYSLHDDGRAWSIPEEIYDSAMTGFAKLDLKKQAAYVVTQQLENAWERRIAEELSNPAFYEASNSLDLNDVPAEAWNSPLANIEDQVLQAQKAIERQGGMRGNKLLLSVDAVNSIKTNPRIRDFLPRGEMVNEEILAKLFDVDEVQIARITATTEQSNGTLDYLWKNNALLFYSPAGKTQKDLVAADYANRATHSFCYTYLLKNQGVQATAAQFNELNDTYWGKVKITRSFEKVGLGENGLLASGFLFSNVTNPQYSV